VGFPGTRLTVHPGAQQSLFPSATFRYWGCYADGGPVDLDVQVGHHRDSGLTLAIHANVRVDPDDPGPVMLRLLADVIHELGRVDEAAELP
jgi:hypothetical protein